VLGEPEITRRLLAFNKAGMDFRTAEGQHAFLDILAAVRQSVLPREPSLDRDAAAEMLFEINRVRPGEPTSA
jgi:hypothetical protein